MRKIWPRITSLCSRFAMDVSSQLTQTSQKVAHFSDGAIMLFLIGSRIDPQSFNFWIRPGDRSHHVTVQQVQ